MSDRLLHHINNHGLPSASATFDRPISFTFKTSGSKGSTFSLLSGPTTR